MKATGYVCGIDDLGRVAIPKKVRGTLRIEEGNSFEICLGEDGEVILKKRFPLRALMGIAGGWASSFREATGHVVFIADDRGVIASAGLSKKAPLDNLIPFLLNKVKWKKRAIILSGEDAKPFFELTVAPVVLSGYINGIVACATHNPTVPLGALEKKLLEITASFLAKQTRV